MGHSITDIYTRFCKKSGPQDDIVIGPKLGVAELGLITGGPLVLWGGGGASATIISNF